MRELTVDSAASGQRFDKYLKKYFAAASSSFLYKMLRKKNIILNGAKANGSEILQDGDCIRVFFSEETFEKMRGGERSFILFSMLEKEQLSPVKILYEDADMIAADKPAGMLSMPGDGASPNANDKLISHMIRRGELTEERYRTFHPSVVNRLDRNTSGIILFGKTLRGTQFLSKEISEKRLKKYYFCAVHGSLKKGGLFEAWWRKDSSKNMVCVRPESFGDAKPVSTEIFPVKDMGDCSLIKVLLHTGRSHQIRAHLAALGHPLLFDPKYGNPESDKIFSRNHGVSFDHQLLHSGEVVFSDGRKITSPLPEEFDLIK